MKPVCTRCKHLITEDNHVCPTPEYIAARNKLISDACDAEELFGLDELERSSDNAYSAEEDAQGQMREMR